MPDQMVHTGIPMIDVFNSLVESQKLPIFSAGGRPHDRLATGIAQTARLRGEEQEGNGGFHLDHFTAPYADRGSI